MVNEIKSVLTLDDVDFKKKLTDNEKSVLKFSAAVATIGAAATAAAVATASWQDKTGKLAQSAGVSVSAFSKMAVAAEKSNVSQEELSKTLAKISSGSPEVAKKLQAIGVSFTDASGKAKTSTQVFSEVADKVAKAGSTAEQSAIAVRAFGDEGAALVPMLASGARGLDEAASAATKYGSVVSEQAAEAAAKFNDDLADTKNALKGLTSAIGESIIAWVNQGGIMDTVRDKLAEATQWWRGLSDTTKNIIVTIGAVAVAFAALAAGIIAFAAMAPALGAAFSVMFGPVGLIITAAAAAVGAIAYLMTARESAIKVAQREQEQAKKNSAAWADNEQSLYKLSRQTKLTSTEQGELERVKEAVRKKAVELGQAINVEAMSMQDLINKTKEYKALENAEYIKGLIKETNALSESYMQSKVRLEALAVQYKNATPEQYTAALNKELKTYNGIKSELEAVGLKYQKMNEVKKEAIAIATSAGAKQKPPEILYQSDVLAAFQAREIAAEKYAGATKEEIEKLEDAHREEQRAATSNAEQVGIAYAKMAQSAINAVGPAIQAASMVTDAMSKSVQYAARVAARDLDVISIRTQRAYEQQKEAIETESAAAIDNITSSYDARISAVTMGEASITAAIEMERNKRLLADDAEYQAAVEALRLQFEAKRALIEQNSLDIEQRRLNDAVAEQSFQQQLANLASEFAGKKDKTNKDADAKATAQKKITDEQIKKLEAEKNAALELSKKTSDEKLKALDEKKAADDKALEKQKLQTQYDAEVQEFNQTKAVKSVQTIASGIASAAQAFAATAASLPFGLGIPIGLGIAATIMGATYASVNQINSQQPVKPAALIAAKGGTLTAGETHYGPSGGIDVKAERGETILSSALTDKLESTLESGSGSQNIYFQDGAIRVMELSREMVMEIARAVGDEVRREGFAI